MKVNVEVTFTDAGEAARFLAMSSTACATPMYKALAVEFPRDAHADADASAVYAAALTTLVTHYAKSFPRVAEEMRKLMASAA